MGLRFDKISYVKGVTKITTYDEETQWKTPGTGHSEPLDSFHVALQKFVPVVESRIPFDLKKVREIRINGFNIKSEGITPYAVKISLTVFWLGDDEDENAQPLSFPVGWFYFNSDQKDLFDNQHDIGTLVSNVIKEAKRYLNGEFKVMDGEESNESADDIQGQIDVENSENFEQPKIPEPEPELESEPDIPSDPQVDDNLFESSEYLPEKLDMDLPGISEQPEESENDNIPKDSEPGSESEIKENNEDQDQYPPMGIAV